MQACVGGRGTCFLDGGFQERLNILNSLILGYGVMP